MQILAIGHGKSRVVLDGAKLLELLGLSEDNLTSEEIAQALLTLSEEEREEIFRKCTEFTRSEIAKMLEEEKEKEEKRLKFSLPTTRDYIDYSHLELERTPEEIKKELKYEKNPMRIRQLNQELTASYKSIKGKW